MDIKSLVKKLKRKYKTCNVFELASAMGILVFFEELGTINGYYSKQYRIKQIHINCNLPSNLQTLTCAHELGHAIMHPDSSTPFLRSSTFFSVDKMEAEANKFAMELLISDDDLMEYQYYTVGQLATLFGYHERLIELRLK